MGKLRDVWNRSAYEIRGMLQKYPFTVAAVGMWTILEIIFLESEQMEIRHLLLPFFVYVGIGFFFSETLYFKRRWEKAVKIAISTAVSLLLAYGKYTAESESLPGDALSVRIRTVYIAVLLICGVYMCWRQSKLSLPQYMLKVFSNLIKMHIAYSILTVSSLIVTAIICILLIDDYTYSALIMRVLVFITGFFYIPSWLISLNHTAMRAERFIKVLVKYILCPLTGIQLLIVYIYVVKILALRDIPSNQIYSILTYIFLSGAAAWTMVQAMKEEQGRVWQKAAEIIPWTFLPLLLLQVYSVGIRIWEYGVTPQRYLGAFWIVMEGIYFLIYGIRRKSVGNMLLVGAGVLIVSLLFPFINMYSVSVYSQEAILSRYHEGVSYTENEQRKMYGAYEYLSNTASGMKYIEQNYTEKECAEIEEFASGSYDSDGYVQGKLRYAAGEVRLNELNIEGYSHLYHVSAWIEPNGDENAFRSVKLQQMDTEEIIETVDLEEIITQYMAYAREQEKSEDYVIILDEYLSEHHEIVVEGRGTLILTNIQIDYEGEDGDIIDVYLEGYFLSRE